MAAGPRPLGVKKKGAGVAAGRHGAETTQPRPKVNGKGGRLSLIPCACGLPTRLISRIGARDRLWNLRREEPKLMLSLTPPGLYDVSITLLRALAATYERHGRHHIPVLVYHPKTVVRDQDDRGVEALPPSITTVLYRPADVPTIFRRWFLDCPFAIAIPEAVWRACPQRLLDFDSSGSAIVLKDRWDGPEITPPAITL